MNPTIVSGGSFISNIPERCDLALNITYLPGNADAGGYGRFEGRGRAGGGRRRPVDDWLAEHPPTWSWYTDYPPSEIDPDADRRAPRRRGATSTSMSAPRASTPRMTARS